MDVGRIQAIQGTKTLPFSGIFNPATALEVEVGMSGSFQSQANALALFTQWAAAIGFLDEVTPDPVQQETLRVVDSFMWPDATYRLTDERYLKEFAPVKAGETLMVSDSGPPVKTSKDGLLMWCPRALRPRSMNCTKKRSSSSSLCRLVLCLAMLPKNVRRGSLVEPRRCLMCAERKTFILSTERWLSGRKRLT